MPALTCLHHRGWDAPRAVLHYTGLLPSALAAGPGSYPREMVDHSCVTATITKVRALKTGKLWPSGDIVNNQPIRRSHGKRVYSNIGP